MSDGKGEYNLIINVPDATTNDVRSGTPSIVAPKRITLPPAARASVPILSYCFASILMTVTNKYVTVTTVVFLWLFKFLNLIKYRDFDWDESRKWFPITVFLVAMIYTGSKALQYLRIPIYTIFKNLTIILIAYGEVLWFGGAVTRLMLVSFFLIVLSSVIAGWSDISEAMNNFTEPNATQTTFLGYFWMANNCFWSGAYVLYMRKRIKLTNFKDFDTMFYNNLLSIPLLLVLSLGFEDWGQENLLKNL
ncbi:hypothetical protein BC937DRAFT_95155 [Endogone sp. FLAS-F59071]|nr:hypothetical protein BC937DRAFT_95155 [Endogone sp. FLAS-F59071]|eukprot:RUS13539.1 hypothetical protein BC937DRAFT_95155 [Endogone sp. FLAS-F59071]